MDPFNMQMMNDLYGALGLFAGLTFVCALIQVVTQWVKKQLKKLPWCKNINPQHIAFVLSLSLLFTHIQFFNVLLSSLMFSIPAWLDTFFLTMIIGFFGTVGLHELANMAGINRNDDGSKIDRWAPRNKPGKEQEKI